jgi:N-acetyl-anhydromuramyl-L-alanine amidase AmpD
MTLEKPSLLSKFMSLFKSNQYLPPSRVFDPGMGVLSTSSDVKGLEAYPPAQRVVNNRMKTRGTYALGYPRGAVVHYTAGRFAGGVKKALDTIDGGIKNGYAYLCISYDGIVVQAHPITQWGYHAGESAWKNVASKFALQGTVSDDLIGIEMNNAGKLTREKDGRFKTWWGDYIPAENVREVKDKSWGCPLGFYQKYTLEQERALIELLLWLKHNDKKDVFSFDNVLGHHEVSGIRGIGYFRKQDPGGSLSMPMDQFREHLKSLWIKREAERGQIGTTNLGANQGRSDLSTV